MAISKGGCLPARPTRAIRIQDQERVVEDDAEIVGMLYITGDDVLIFAVAVQVSDGWGAISVYDAQIGSPISLIAVHISYDWPARQGTSIGIVGIQVLMVTTDDDGRISTQ